MGILFPNLLLESIFNLSGQTENTQIRVFVYFLFDHFPKSKIELKRECPYFYSKFLLLKSFGQYLKKSKNGFPIVFSKSDLTGVGSLFLRKKILKKPNTPKYA